jgi:predicted Zn-dependent protease
MKNPIVQLLLSLVLFFGAWLGLAQLPLTRWLHVRQFAAEKQQQLGDYVLKTYLESKTEYKTDSIPDLVGSIKNRICLANGIDTGSIRLHVVHDEVINAFALPGGNIVVNDGLILLCDNPDMLAGVLAHEIGHIKHDHITKKITKELGLTALSVAAGGKNAEMIRKVLKQVTSASFDRVQEQEADTAGVGYLVHVRIDPAAMAYFFKKMEKEAGSTPGWAKWINTHPDSKDRAADVLALRPARDDYKPSMEAESWERLKRNIRALREAEESY